MPTNINDFLPWLPDRPDLERAWLASARRGDTLAAAELLQWYLRDNWLAAEDVREAVETGIKTVVQNVALSALGVSEKQSRGKSPKVNALMFFRGTQMEGRRGVKPNVNDRVRLLTIHSVGLLTEKDLDGALAATGSEDPRVHHVEARLMERVAKTFKGVGSQACREYVHASFKSANWSAGADASFVRA